jgi:proteic killer suppression protein
MILSLLDVVQAPDELNLPALRLNLLKRNLVGHWSVWVSGNWRVIFRFDGANVELVNYQDDH